MFEFLTKALVCVINCMKCAGVCQILKCLQKAFSCTSVINVSGIFILQLEGPHKLIKNTFTHALCNYDLAVLMA